MVVLPYADPLMDQFRRCRQEPPQLASSHRSGEQDCCIGGPDPFAPSTVPVDVPLRTLLWGTALRDANFDRYETLNRLWFQSAPSDFQCVVDSVLPTVKGLTMSPIIRLVSFADSDNATTGETEEVSVRHEAELDNGKLVLLLDNRGWSSIGRWSDARRRDIEETARVVVGPDEPYGEQSVEVATTGHWAFIQEILAVQGIEVEVSELRKMRHDVVLSKRLQDRLDKGSNPSG